MSSISDAIKKTVGYTSAIGKGIKTGVEATKNVMGKADTVLNKIGQYDAQFNPKIDYAKLILSLMMANGQKTNRLENYSIRDSFTESDNGSTLNSLTLLTEEEMNKFITMRLANYPTPEGKEQEFKRLTELYAGKGFMLTEPERVMMVTGLGEKSLRHLLQNENKIDSMASLAALGGNTNLFGSANTLANVNFNK